MPSNYIAPLREHDNYLDFLIKEEARHMVALGLSWNTVAKALSYSSGWVEDATRDQTPLHEDEVDLSVRQAFIIRKLLDDHWDVWDVANDVSCSLGQVIAIKYENEPKRYKRS